LQDVDEGILKRTAQTIKDGLKKFFVDKGKMTKEKADEIFASIKFMTGLKEAAKNADLVIESVPEVMALKKNLQRTGCDLPSSHHTGHKHVLA